jgi:hypothetical protein
MIRALIGACVLVIIMQGAGVSWARLSDPGLSEPEIRRKWKDFHDVRDRGSVQGNYPYMACFEEAARKHNVPLPLLVAVARGESNFDPKARSIKDCYGIMQIQWPGTAKDLGIHRKTDLLDPCTNIHAGARYLSWLLERYGGDPYLAVAAYNYGPNAVTPGRVPEGARWYAAYIHRHLQSVTSIPEPKIGEILLLRFTTYDRAVRLVEYLEKMAIGIPFEIFKDRYYTYDVYMTYKTTNEKAAYLRCLMETTGISPLNGGKR